MDTLNDLLSQINQEKSASGQAADAQILQNLVQQGMTRGLGVSPTRNDAMGQVGFSGTVGGYSGALRPEDAPSYAAGADIPVYYGSPGGKNTGIGIGLSPQTIQARSDAGGALRGLVPQDQAEKASQGFQATEKLAPHSANEVAKGVLEKLGVGENDYNKAYQTAAGKAAGEGLTTGGFDEMAKMLSERKLDPTILSRMRDQHKAEIIRKGLLLDPSLDMKDYKREADLLKDFTSGKGSAFNIDRLNTAVPHLAHLKAAGDALQNTNMKAFNWGKNMMKDFKGDPEISDYLDAAQGVAGEMAAVFKNGTGTDVEIQKWLKRLSSSDSPRQIQQNFDTMVSLMRDRATALDNRFKTGMKGKSFPIWSPEAQAVFKQIGADTGANSKAAAPAAAPAAGAPAAGEPTEGVMPDGKRWRINPATGKKQIEE